MSSSPTPQKLGAEPYLCANLGTGTWDEAQRWVEYCNHADGTEMARMRQRNGREKPWGVKYWGLGNEMDGPWQMGHRDAEDYGKFALEAAKMMKWTDPSIHLIAAGLVQLRRRLDRLEPHRAAIPQEPHRLHLTAHVCRQSGATTTTSSCPHPWTSTIARASPRA